MAGLRFEQLVVLTGTLVVVLLQVPSVQGWTRINETQLLSLYKPGLWGEPASGPYSDYVLDYDDADLTEDEDLTGDFDLTSDVDLTEDEDSDHTVDADGVPSGVVPSFAYFEKEPDFALVEGDSGPSWPWTTESDFQVEFEEEDGLSLPPRRWSSSVSPDFAALTVDCSEGGFHISAPRGLVSEIIVLGTMDLELVTNASDTCGYEVDLLEDALTVPFTGCHVKNDENGYRLQMLYVDESSQMQISTASCVFGVDLNPRSTGSPECCEPALKVTQSPAPPNPTWAPAPAKAQNCGVPTEERVSCGSSGISSSECEKKGCCVDKYKNNCYYPMDECTADQHFVFAIRSSGAPVPVDPTKLIIPGNPHCQPAIVNEKFAIFKFKLKECGSRVYEIGEMKIYQTEVQTVVKALNLKYGIITRSDPLRFMIECRYSKCGSAKQSLASIGYMVKTPTSSLPSSIFSIALYGVELRIAKDNSYSSYFPTYHQPLQLLLGKPVHLELRLRTPKPDAVLLVNYCLAYPRSANSALVLIHEGCANPNDPTVAILHVSHLPESRHHRRFKVNAFQFMDPKTNKYLNEEIYFMCSAEVCSPSEKKCEEGCFGKRL